MAIVNYPLGSFINDQITASLQYDDGTLRINSYTIVNSYAHGKMIATIIDKTTHAIIDTLTVNANTGTTTKSLLGFNVSMVHSTGTGKYGPYDQIVPPFDYSIEFQGT